MKLFITIVIVAGLIGLGVALTIEAPFALVFGWIAFLWRVLPKVTADQPSLIVGCAAFVLFAVGVHGLGVSWRRSRVDPEGATRRWKLRWSLAIVGAVCVSFAAGICLVGIVHQGIWMFGSERPLTKTVPELRYGSTSANHLRMMSLAVIKSVDDHDGKIPPPFKQTLDGTEIHSWETAVLSNMSFSSHGIDPTQAWNAPANQRYFKCVIPYFINPELPVESFLDAEGYGVNHYSANVQVFAANPRLRYPGGFRGTSRTILIGEINAAFQPWGKPGNWRDPAMEINRSPRGFGGPPGSGGALFSMADGSVRFVSDKVSPEVLKAMSDPRGGKPPDDIDDLAPKQ